jgi:hypothetical protein
MTGQRMPATALTGSRVTEAEEAGLAAILRDTVQLEGRRPILRRPWLAVS